MTWTIEIFGFGEWRDPDFIAYYYNPYITGVV